MLKYFFTTFGVIYAGYKFEEMQFPNHTVVIQASKLRDYRKLPLNEKTFDKIQQYGWILHNQVICKTVNKEDIEGNNSRYQSDSWHGNFQRKNMFIFGAGASAHCVYGDEKEDFYEDDLRPPIGPALFQKRFKKYYSKYRGVKQSIHFLQDGTNPDVEALFEKEWKNVSKDNNQEVLSRHINIQYFLQEVLQAVSKRVRKEYFGQNLYAVLADKLQKIHAASKKQPKYNAATQENFAFVSFNQDTILEDFLSEYFRLPIQSMDDYVNCNESPFCIFKPHGSSNWGWKFPDAVQFDTKTAEWLFENRTNFFQLYYELLGNYQNMIDWSTWGIEASINRHHLGRFTIDKSQIQLIPEGNINRYYPALLLPYRDKDEFTMPLCHYFNMRHYLDYVENLFIIGWKGNEEAFNRELLRSLDRRKLKKVVVADPNAEVVIKNLEPILSKFNIEPIIYKNFEQFVLEGLEKELNTI